MDIVGYIATVFVEPFVSPAGWAYLLPAMVNHVVVYLVLSWLNNFTHCVTGRRVIVLLDEHIIQLVPQIAHHFNGVSECLVVVGKAIQYLKVSSSLKTKLTGGV